MLGVTLFGIFLTPVFFYVIQGLGSKKKAAVRPAPVPPPDGKPHDEPRPPAPTLEALEGLVRSGSPQAYTLLEALANGAGGGSLAEEARASLQRLSGVTAKA
jgi:hypothetical protein